MCGIVKTGWWVGALIVLALGTAAVAVWRSDKAGTGSGLRGEFTYDLAPFMKTDPRQILYTETAAIVTDFKQPRALAVGPRDSVYVAGDKTIRWFDAAGRRADEIGNLAGTPGCLAVAADGTIYAGLRDHVEVYAPQPGPRQPQAVWASLGEKATLTSLAAGKTDVFAADAGNRVVIRYDRTGKELGRIGRRDKERDIRGLVIPSPYFDVALSADGLLEVANTGLYRIEAYRFNGDFVSAWGERGTAAERFCGCCNPAHFTLLPDGSFVTAEKGLCRVKCYDAHGAFLGFVAGPELFLQPGQKYDAEHPPESHPTVVPDLAADSRGRVLVLDPGSGNVRVFEKNSGK